MTVERTILSELASRLKKASDAAETASGELAKLQAGNGSMDPRVVETMQRVQSLNAEIAVMRRILNVSWLFAMSRSPLVG